MDGATSLAEMIISRFVPAVFNVNKVFFGVGVKHASSFTDVELRASGAKNDIQNVVRQAVELFCDVHVGLGASSVGFGADKRTCSTFCLIAWSGPWCSCGWLTQLRSHQRVPDSVAFVCDQWWLTEDHC